MAWTEQVQGGNVPPARTRPRLPGWLTALIVLVGLALVAVVAIRMIGGGGGPTIGPATEDSNSSTPTVSGWNEGVPTPDPSSAAPLNCDPGADRSAGTQNANSATVGPLTMPSPGADWTRAREHRMPLGSDGYGYLQVLPEQKSWASSMSIGLVADPDFVSTAGTARLMAQCVLTSGFYVSVDVTMDDYAEQSITVDGASATQADFTVRFDHPELVTKGSKLRIIVIDSAPRTWFFAAVPMERDDHIALVDTVSQGMTLEG